MSKAHPRSRGENSVTCERSSSISGSSPLTRGKQQRRYVFKRLERLIPAHAGKTYRFTAACAQPPAHPRSRGENEIARAEDVNSNGSSPLTRGKRSHRSDPPACLRLIPAHAGKTAASWRTRPRARAHPRSRGENSASPTPPDASSGSSPLTRGKRAVVSTSLTPCRLIPAHAGKTTAAAVRRRRRWAHPRSRGENCG